MTNLGIACFLLAIQQETPDSFFQYKPGTYWKYACKENGKEGPITVTVIEEEKGRVRVSWDKGSLGEKEVWVWEMKESILTYGPDTKDGWRLPVYKTGSKKGDTWKSGDLRATHEETSELKVPAGTYKDVLRIEIPIEDQDPITFYLAPNVGLIKMEMTGQFLLELTEFKPKP